MTYSRALLIALPTLGILIAAACGDSSSLQAGGAPDDFGDSSGQPGDGPGAGGGDAGLPPEEELESSYSAPVATGTFVWIANPTSGRVAYINATTLEINVVEAGHAPTYIAAVPDADEDVAIVLNVLSKDATVLRAKGDALAAESLAVPSSGNAWAVSENGRWAVAWTDSRRVENADPIDGFQDITVLDLTQGASKSTALTVGYRPVAVAFNTAGTRAFAVTQDGITAVSLEGGEPAVTQNIKLSDKPADDATTRDVAITPDGSYALVRKDGEAQISVFSLANGDRTDVALPAPATDIDLSPDGSVAVAVIRDTGEVGLLPIPGIVSNPASFPLIKVEGTLIGSTALADESPLAFLYTNAVPSSVLAVLDTSKAAPAPDFIQLWAPIKAVFPTKDAAHAIVLHETIEGGGSQYPGAVSVVPVAEDLPAKITGLDAPPVSVAIAPAGHRALIATGDEAHPSFRLYVASMPSLQIAKYTLASEPIAAGIVAGADRGFVAQKHPDGRITFVDFKTGEVRTLTGFELATQVVDGSGE
jgi:DNA-binding beta-propeller fold protein YncE